MKQNKGRAAIKWMLGVGVVLIIYGTFNASEPATKTLPPKMSVKPKHKPPAACDGSTITGKKHGIIGSGIDVYSAPSELSERIVNKKATEILKETHYISLSDTVTVVEECINGEWSWVRVVDPAYLTAHQGWVLSKNLDKGQDLGGDKYTRLISSTALDPYTEKSYPDYFKTFGSRMTEIEIFRRKAAEMAADSGKCDKVTTSDLSSLKSTIDHLRFFVDCKNGQRIYLDEVQIKEGGSVLTQAEKAWTEEEARLACQQGIKDRALIPDAIDIPSVFGTSFYRAPTTHNVVLTMDFDVKSVAGVEASYTATCHFAPGELGEIVIKTR